MTYTEEEAKIKWCPFARTPIMYFDPDEAGAADEFKGTINRTFKGKASICSMCIASECMAWRWTYRFVHMETGEGTHYNPKQGFCGLAGKP